MRKAWTSLTSVFDPALLGSRSLAFFGSFLRLSWSNKTFFGTGLKIQEIQRGITGYNFKRRRKLTKETHLNTVVLRATCVLGLQTKMHFLEHTANTILVWCSNDHRGISKQHERNLFHKCNLKMKDLEDWLHWQMGEARPSHICQSHRCLTL